MQSQGDAMSKAVRGVVVVVAMVIDLVSCSSGGGPTLTFAQPAPPGGAQPATGIYVRRGGGYVWVPLDASGSPQIPGAASPGPSAPPAPPAPGAPPQPPSGSWGFLRADVAPGDASLYIDGRGVGSANQFIGPDQFVALTPGLHRVEVRKWGFKPARVVVEIAAAQTHLLHLQLTPDPTGSSAPSGSESDSLTADIPPGGGYFVVPTR
jgi:hypothetical protein